VPELEVMDSTFIGVRPVALAAVVADPSNWRSWWPDLDLSVDEWRATKGVRWTIRSGRPATVSGSMEIWLEAADDATLAHYFLRLDGVDRPLSRRERARIERHYRAGIKRVFWGLSDRLDPGRLARVAEPRVGVP
jgi:hypothetical protein